MSDGSYPPPRPQSVSELLDAGFRSFRATLLACLPYAALAMIAGRLPEIWDLLVGSAPGRAGSASLPIPGMRDGLHLVLALLAGLISIVFWNATLLRQHARLSGSPGSILAELRRGAQRAPAVFVLTALGILAAIACLLPMLALPRFLRLWAVLLLALPVSAVTLVLSCAWPVLLLEGLGVPGSLRRGLQLVSGHYLRVGLVWTVGTVAIVVFYVICVIVVAVLFPPLAGGIDVAVMTAVTTVILVVLGGVALPLFGALTLAVYGDLKARREGTDLQRRLNEVAPV